MTDYCVVVADSYRARFFTLEAARIPEVESGPNLVEHRDLVNPEVAILGRDQFSDLKSGRNTAPGGGPAHGYDDHRDRHEDELDRRFARRIAATAMDVVREHGAKCLVLALSSRMLGFLRDAIRHPGAAKLEVRETAKDLTNRKPIDIHHHLSEANLLPARENRTQRQGSSGPGSGANWSG